MDTAHQVVAVFYQPPYYTLTVNVVGSGTVTKNPNQATYASGTIVTLSAAAASGWSFSSYSGGVSSNNPVATVTMNGNKVVTATFTQAPPTYTLTTSVVGSGSVTKNPSQTQYASGTVVTLTANPASGWSFKDWSGAITGSTNPATITMNGNKAVTATFTQNPVYYTLTTSVVGSGSLTKNPSQAQYASGTVVTLTASPASGWSFKGWSGAITSSTNPTTITMNSNKAITATFTQNPVYYTLTTSVTGSGSVTKNPSQTQYLSGAIVTLTANPSSGYSFKEWSGAITGSTNPATVTMNGNKVVTATFTQNPVYYTLTTSVIGSGDTDPAPGTRTYSKSETVVVNAYPDNGWVLDYWLLDGENAGSAGSCTVTMDQNHTLNAIFADESPVQAESDLIISVVGSGTTNPGPGTHVTDTDTSVTVTASPASGWKFSYWMLDGVNIGSGISCTFTVDQDYVLTAIFVEDNSQPNDEFELTISVVGSGTTDPAPGTYAAEAGSSTVVDAYPLVDWELDYWSLDGVNIGSAGSCPVTMDQDHILTAKFREVGSAGEDTVPPVIGEPVLKPGVPTNDNNVIIEVVVTDETEVVFVTLFYRVSAGEWIGVSAESKGEVWSAIIPKQAENSTVDFYFESQDGQGNYAESDIIRYFVKAGGTDLWVVAGVIGGIASVTIGAAAFIAKTGGRSILNIAHRASNAFKGKKLRLKEEGKTKDVKERKHEEKPKLELTLISPTIIRSGGFAYARGEIKNVGEATAHNVELKIRGPQELKPIPPAIIGNIDKKASKAFRIKLESTNEFSAEKKTLSYTLAINGNTSHTIVRAFNLGNPKIGLLEDSHNLAYLKKAALNLPDNKHLISWLIDSRFEYEKIQEAEDFETLLKYDVIIASSQLALSDKDVLNLKKYVESGRGLVSMDGTGTVSADACLKGEANCNGEQRIYNLLGYGRPDISNIEKGLKGIRISQNKHPVTEMYKQDEIITLLAQTGVAFKGAVSTAKMLADQHVSLRGTRGFTEISSVVAGIYGKGRVVHFNFNAGAVIGEVSLIVTQAIQWASRYE